MGHDRRVVAVISEDSEDWLNLWFDNQAEEAAKFYVSVFKNSKIKTVTHYDPSARQ
jgi:predicted 3-demethylubiquinone-9 3-methyltransferase (glyoxalase superfamily)